MLPAFKLGDTYASFLAKFETLPLDQANNMIEDLFD
jgi:hypothetical protein